MAPSAFLKHQQQFSHFDSPFPSEGKDFTSWVAMTFVLTMCLPTSKIQSVQIKIKDDNTKNDVVQLNANMKLTGT